MEYSEDTCKVILDKVQQKGWNIYHTNDNLSREENIKNNLVEGNLEKDKH